ncbi:hypothetical protein HT102_03765 [Hoyosella sp. G463]|uniref:Uncharacterized protein n=1 Tax=Lolliginicoccus lacisalsi TaxID=2742202 RepID=A0A927JBY3_9ACTN|nr:hypothetical protein [Lolliginicoccus lacisalsi]MBD8505602.1 hypothetical protein [Lolliginicoccus lacisalsi]
MHTRSRAPWPPEWPRTAPLGRTWLGIVVLALLAVGALAAGITGLADGTPVVLVIGLLFGIALGLTAAYLVARSIRPRFRRSDILTTTDRDGTPVTRIRQSALLFHLRTAIIAALALAFAISAIDHYASTGSEGLLGVLIYVLLAGFFGSYVLAATTGALAPGHLDLSAHSVHHRGWSFEATMPWRTLLVAQPVFEDRHHGIQLIGDPGKKWEHAYTVRLWRIDRVALVPIIDLDTRRFRIPPDVLAACLAHYAMAAPDRAELGTDRALARIARWWPEP